MKGTSDHPKVRTLILKVKRYPSDLHGRLLKIPGLIGVEVNWVEDFVKVEYDPGVISEAAIRQNLDAVTRPNS